MPRWYRSANAYADRHTHYYYYYYDDEKQSFVFYSTTFSMIRAAQEASIIHSDFIASQQASASNIIVSQTKTSVGRGHSEWLGRRFGSVLSQCTVCMWSLSLWSVHMSSNTNGKGRNAASEKNNRTRSVAADNDDSSGNNNNKVVVFRLLVIHHIRHRHQRHRLHPTIIRKHLEKLVLVRIVNVAFNRDVIAGNTRIKILIRTMNIINDDGLRPNR